MLTKIEAFKKCYPEDFRVSDAVKGAKDFESGKISRQALKKIRRAAGRAAEKIEYARTTYAYSFNPSALELYEKYSKGAAGAWKILEYVDQILESGGAKNEKS
mgnify:CR=1 FL=1